jgi:hypothetical protein
MKSTLGGVSGNKFPMAQYFGLAHLGKTNPAAARRPIVFARSDRTLEGIFAQPTWRRVVPIRWVETPEQLFRINVKPLST